MDIVGIISTGIAGVSVVVTVVISARKRKRAEQLENEQEKAKMWKEINDLKEKFNRYNVELELIKQQNQTINSILLEIKTAVIDLQKAVHQVEIRLGSWDTMS